MKLAEQSKRKTNAYCRSIDESHLWPICGRFNVTERAMRRVAKLQSESYNYYSGETYIYHLESEISRIVNAEA